MYKTSIHNNKNTNICINRTYITIRITNICINRVEFTFKCHAKKNTIFKSENYNKINIAF